MGLVKSTADKMISISGCKPPGSVLVVRSACEFWNLRFGLLLWKNWPVCACLSAFQLFADSLIGNPTRTGCVLRMMRSVRISIGCVSTLNHSHIFDHYHKRLPSRSSERKLPAQLESTVLFSYDWMLGIFDEMGKWWCCEACVYRSIFPHLISPNFASRCTAIQHFFPFFLLLCRLVFFIPSLFLIFRWHHSGWTAGAFGAVSFSLGLRALFSLFFASMLYVWGSTCGSNSPLVYVWKAQTKCNKVPNTHKLSDMVQRVATVWGTNGSFFFFRKKLCFCRVMNADRLVEHMTGPRKCRCFAILQFAIGIESLKRHWWLRGCC